MYGYSRIHQVKECTAESTLSRKQFNAGNNTTKCFLSEWQNHWKKLAPYGDWWSTLRNWRLCQLQSHVTQKLDRISKIQPNQIQTLCPSLRIHGPLPAPMVNGGGDSCWKWPDFQLWRARDLDLGSGHTIVHRAKFHLNRRNFLWTDGWTFETGFIRSTLSKSRPKNNHFKTVTQEIARVHKTSYFPMSN